MNTFKSRGRILTAGSLFENRTLDEMILFLNIVHIQSNEKTVFIIDKSGSVYGKRMNNHGELGVGDVSPRDDWVPVLIPFPVKKMAIGNNHALFLTENNQVYGCGRNKEKQIQNNMNEILLYLCLIIKKEQNKFLYPMRLV